MAELKEGIVDRICQIFTILVSVYLVVCSILRFVNREDTAIHYILAIYFLFFAAMNICGAIRIQKLIHFFSFLQGGIGTGFFCLFIAFLLFDWERPVEFGCSICHILACLFNWFVGCQSVKEK